MDFAGVEAEFGRLKAQFKSGAVTETEFMAQIEELMIEDEQGRWWVIGYKTGEWYVHDGEKWVQQKPPRAARRAAAAHPPAADLPAVSRPAITAAVPSTVMGLRLGREALSLLLVAAGWLVCLGLWFIALSSTYYLPWTSVFIIVGIGGLITALVSRRTEPPSSWKQVPLVAFGWAIGVAVTWSLWAPLYLRLQWLPSGMTVGLVGALITVLALKWAHPAILWKHVAIVTLGWVIGCAVGGAVGWGLLSLGSLSRLVDTLMYGLWIGISGAVGSWVALWWLRGAIGGSPWQAEPGIEDLPGLAK